MSKVTIKVVSLGYLPADFHREKITQIKSKLITITDPLESFSLNADSDLGDWAYSDELLLDNAPNKGTEDILVILTSVPLQERYYTRIIAKNTVIFTFYDIANYLRQDNIPLSNVIMRLLYAYSLAFLQNNRIITNNEEIVNLTHDETRGCLFDMNGLKEDIIHSCHSPQICSTCTQSLLDKRLSFETVQIVKSEISTILKPKYYRILSWVKRNPVWSIFCSSLWAVFLGVVGSAIASGFN